MTIQPFKINNMDYLKHSTGVTFVQRMPDGNVTRHTYNGFTIPQAKKEFKRILKGKQQ